MMKKMIMLTGGFLLSTSVIASPALKPAQPVQPFKSSASIFMRKQPLLNAKVEREYPANAQLIPFYKKGQWIKVGDPRTGVVGWVEKKQYHKAMSARPNPTGSPVFRQVIVETQQSGAAPQQITVYRNGQLLDQAQSKKMYQKIQQRMLRQQRFMEQQMQAAEQNMFQPVQASILQPIIIFEHPPTQRTKKPVAAPTKKHQQ